MTKIGFFTELAMVADDTRPTDDVIQIHRENGMKPSARNSAT